MYPILFSLGPINIYSFGALLFLAFLAGTFYVWREGRREFEQELLLDALVVIIVTALLGARLFYIFSHFENFGIYFLRWIHVFLFPGFSFWGAILGGISGTFWFARKKKLSFWRLGDFLALGAAIAVIFGQIGCFLNGCAVGKITNLPWGMTVMGFLWKRHPVALYDILAATLIAFVTLKVYRWIFGEKRRRKGSAALVFLSLLAFFSFPLEFLKVSTVYFYGLSLNQWIALVLFTSATSLWYLRLRSFRKDIFLIQGFLKPK